MKTRLKGYLLDIAGACEKLTRFTQGKQYAEYLDDDFMQSAVERQFEVIGEATGQLLRAAPELADSISNSGDIIGFRNNLIHRYASVQHEVVWDILRHHLPVLQTEIQGLLEQAGVPEGDSDND